MRQDHKPNNVGKYLLAIGFILLLMGSCSMNRHLSNIHQLLAQQDSYQQSQDHHYRQFIADREQAALALLEATVLSTTEKGATHAQ